MQRLDGDKLQIAGDGHCKLLLSLIRIIDCKLCGIWSSQEIGMAWNGMLTFYVPLPSHAMERNAASKN